MQLLFSKWDTEIGPIENQILIMIDIIIYLARRILKCGLHLDTTLCSVASKDIL